MARLDVQPGTPQITRENQQQMVAVTAGLDGRDLGSAVKDVQARLAKGLHLPNGYRIEYGGLYASQQQSFQQLAFVLTSALSLSAFVPAGAAAPTYHLLKKISLPGVGGWDYLTIDSQARRLYIARSTHVTVVNIDSGTVAGDIPDTNGVHGIAIDRAANRGFTSNGRANTVTIFDLKTLKKINEVAVGDGPDAILFDPATGRVFTFNGRGQTATAIDAATGKVVGTIALPGRPEFPVTDGKGHLYDNLEDKSEIVSLNSRTLKVDNVWPLAPGDSPSGLAMDVKGRQLFSVCDNQKMTVVDADTGKVVATPTIGNGPDACAFDPLTKLVFSPNGQDGTLTVIKQVSLDQYRTVGVVTTQIGARTMALDPKTHHVFTVTAAALPAAPGDNPRRRSYVPDSFVVLEYGE
ncbi:MAG: efflux RND transporter permease subunit [Janthinobacterium lividum]